MHFGDNTMKISELDEGILDWLKADKQADMQKDVVPMVKQLMDQGMPEDEVIDKVEQDLGVRPRYIRQAIQMVRAGLSETSAAKAKVEMCPDACCGKPVTECSCGPDCKHCDCYEKNKAMNEGFLRNLIGDVRNAFKPGVAVTPNMVKELEAGIAAIKAGGQPTARQQKTFDNFMSDTLAKELKKMGISETTSAGSVASVANPSTSRKKPKKNGGVAPNALDSGDNLMGGKTVRR